MARRNEPPPTYDVTISCPAPVRPRGGNRVHALRWAAHLRSLGHRVRIRTPREAAARPGDLLVALHAARSHDAIVRADEAGVPVVLVLTGTDVYGPEADGRKVAEATARARRIVVLQPLASRRVPPEHRGKVWTIWPAHAARGGAPERPEGPLSALVAAHLRAVKAPEIPARAAQALPADVDLRIEHAGAALEPSYETWAREESERNARWTWLGPLPRREVLRRLAACDLVICPSAAEGGSQSVVEAIVEGKPVLASRIEGNVGLLGSDHPGLFEPGKPAALAALLERAAREPDFLAELRRRSLARAARHTPARERHELRALVESATAQPAGA